MEAGVTPLRGGKKQGGGITFSKREENLFIAGDIAWQATGLLNLLLSILMLLNNLELSLGKVAEKKIRKKSGLLPNPPPAPPPPPVWSFFGEKI